MKELAGITLKQLQAIAAIAQTGSITAASARLGLTPPAVHSQLRAIEANLGCSLVVKAAGGGMELTAEGALVLQAQRMVRASLISCIEQISAMKKGLAGRVVLGVVSTAKYFAPSLVSDMKKDFENIEVKLEVGNRGVILSALEERSIDIAIMGRPPRFPAVKANAIGVHPMLFIAPPDHRLARVANVRADELLDEVIITREPGSGTRILMARYLDRIGEGKPYETVEMGSNETIKQAVIAGLGIAMISQHTVTEELRSGRLVALKAPELPIERQWYVLHRADLAFSPAMERVWNFVCSKGPQYLPRL